MTDEYTLDNAEERASQNPDTFQIPTLSERQSVKEGDSVKLIFMPLDPEAAFGGERMWVTVTDTSNPTFFLGTLDNEPVCFDDLTYGDQVLFTAANIISIY